MVMINCGDYWQCGFVIPKGSFDKIQQNGLTTFRDEVAKITPFPQDRAGELNGWNDIKLLTVIVDRLRQWYRPGLLCISEAAHAMSPIGGVGINLAIQDAVTSTNILANRFRKGTVTTEELQRVQRRGVFPTYLTQRLQLFIQNRVIRRVLGSSKKLSLPLPLKLLRHTAGRLTGIDFRPEHIRTPTRSNFSG
jgi:2-polyprenyl-6-methoxyphenol hydroxylase-like FAD-dependent oxidoreductase